MPKSAVDFVDGSHTKTTLMAATLPPYNKAEAPVSHYLTQRQLDPGLFTRYKKFKTLFFRDISNSFQ